MVGKENRLTLEDLAVAFAINWIATGGPLFGWYDKSIPWSYVVRAAGGELDFRSDGLVVNGIHAFDSDDNVAVSSRALPRR